MGGCTNCKGKSGCDDRKGEMFETIDHWLHRLYPSHTWGEISAEEAISSPLDIEMEALSDDLGNELKASTFFQPGTDSDLCDYIYILCQGREPSALQVRYSGVAIPEEWDPEQELVELYLRVAVSSVAPLAVVQQVRTDLSFEEDTWMLRERISAGVFDAPLLKRMQRLVSILPAYDLIHLDMGEISHPPPGFSAGAYKELYGVEAHTSNYFFFRDPSTLSTTAALVPRHESRAL